MTEYEFLLKDRIQKIQQINEEYNLEKNAYIAFSGGKDSTVLHYLIDMALPNNQIPRVYINTGIDYKLIHKFIEQLKESDSRFIEVKPTRNIREILEEDGYPFKSKEHSKKYHLLKAGSDSEVIKKYWRIPPYSSLQFSVPKILEYQRDVDLPFKVSDFCCSRLKKEPSLKWQRENKKTITLTGVRNDEGGQRANIKSCLAFKKGKLNHFLPLLPLDNNFINEFIKENEIELCRLYYPPYNFVRTGCKGCPFALDIKKNLEILEKFFPAERKQCEIVFGKVYNEYRRLGYRLDKEEVKE